MIDNRLSAADPLGHIAEEFVDRGVHPAFHDWLAIEVRIEDVFGDLRATGTRLGADHIDVRLVAAETHRQALRRPIRQPVSSANDVALPQGFEEQFVSAPARSARRCSARTRAAGARWHLTANEMGSCALGSDTPTHCQPMAHEPIETASRQQGRRASGARSWTEISPRFLRKPRQQGSSAWTAANRSQGSASHALWLLQFCAIIARASPMRVECHQVRVVT
jgi:hypothetical protein